MNPSRVIDFELNFFGFVRMYNWAQLLAFEYVCLIPDESDRAQMKNPEPGANDGRQKS